MKLSFEMIKEITSGAECVLGDDGVHFERFSLEERRLYHERGNTPLGSSFPMKVPATAGVTLSFYTDSTVLDMSFLATPASSRCYFGVSVYMDGELLLLYDNLNEGERSDPLGSKSSFGECEHSFRVPLGEWGGNITVYLPWSASLVLKEIGVDDGASFLPKTPKKKLLAYGDSITQGYDSHNPANRYTARLASLLSAAEYNKAIGGEVFFPALADLKQDYIPDYISVAYGTNDWGRGIPYDEFAENCKQFFANLRKNYPETPIIAITPIWRGDAADDRGLGAHSLVRDYIVSIAEEYNLKVVVGDGLVPPEPVLFADRRLHPNDDGFAYYSDRLILEVARLLELQFE